MQIQSDQEQSRWQRLRANFAERGFAFFVALALEVALFLLLVTLGTMKDKPELAGEKLTSFDIADETRKEDDPQDSPAPAAAPQPSAEQPQPESQPVPSRCRPRCRHRRQ